MKRTQTITVLAAETQDTLNSRGADIEQSFDFIKDAKSYAKRVLTEDYRLACESSTQMGYSQVMVDGECLYDFFGRG